MTTSEAMNRAELDDLLSDEAVNRPWEYWPRLRAVHPVYWNARWNGWIVTGYDAVVAGYRDSERLSSDRFSGPFGAEIRASETRHAQLIAFLSRFFVWKDPPFHTGMRLLVNRAFTPKSVEELRPRVRSLVAELGEPLRGRAEVDFLPEFAFTLPVVVIAEFLGIPSEARFEVRDWSNDLGAVVFTSGDEENRMRRGERAMGKLVEFLRPIVRERQRAPQDDLVTRLCQAEVNGARLAEDDIIANVVLMVFAGHETTMNLLASGMIAFDRFPEQWARLRADPSLVRQATEEMLRFDGPIKGLGRWAKTSFEFFGQQIREGDRLLLVQHAANRDPAAFADPDRFDIGRNPNRHAAFGQGIHTCLGAPLARLEVNEALLWLTANFGGVEVLDHDLRYARTIVARAVERLSLRFLPA
jgi:cytochrome P450